MSERYTNVYASCVNLGVIPALLWINGVFWFGGHPGPVVGQFIVKGIGVRATSVAGWHTMVVVGYVALCGMPLAVLGGVLLTCHGSRSDMRDVRPDLPAATFRRWTARVLLVFILCFVVQLAVGLAIAVWTKSETRFG